MGGYLEYLGAQTLTEMIRQTISEEIGVHMSNIEQDLDNLGTEIQQELQQVKDALASLESAVAGQTAAEEALAQANATLDAASARVQQFTSDLASDDPPESAAP